MRFVGYFTGRVEGDYYLFFSGNPLIPNPKSVYLKGGNKMIGDAIIKILMFLATALRISQSLCVNSSILQDVTNLMEKITQHTIMAVNRQNSDIFRDMGHIGEVPNEFHDFAMAAAIPGIFDCSIPCSCTKLFSDVHAHSHIHT